MCSLVKETEIPDEFKCIVTGKIMTDPVTCDDGYTYDRESIENLCHMISSKTYKRITTLISNKALKNSIDRFIQGQSVSQPQHQDDIPEEFKCIVTGNIMFDPVTCDDGYTYDRYSIEKLCDMISIKTFKWITTIISNRALKSSIDRFNEDKFNILIKELDILQECKKEKVKELISVQDQLDLIDVRIASIKFEKFEKQDIWI